MNSHKIQPSPIIDPYPPPSSKTTTQIQLQQNLTTKNQQIHQIQFDIFDYLGLEFKVNQIKINGKESLHTVYVESLKEKNKQTCFYLTHGFGGSALMYFPIIKYLLEYGSVVMWEVRGMGLSKKLKKYDVRLEDTEDFFVSPIETMLKYYNHKNIFFISHSFGGYLTLLYILKYKTFNKNIKEIILLSPVGITPKQDDYKYHIKSCSDALITFGNKISWTFGITYKSPFRCICACFKQKVFRDAVEDYLFQPEEKILMKDLILAMVDLRDGSENVFFNYFLPRVLPKFPIEPRFTKKPKVPIKIVYGGQEDWVDKTGAQKLKDRFPNQIQVKLVKDSSHNFPFYPVQLKQILEQIFFPHLHSQQNSILKTQQPKRKKASKKGSKSSKKLKKQKQSPSSLIPNIIYPSSNMSLQQSLSQSSLSSSVSGIHKTKHQQIPQEKPISNKIPTKLLNIRQNQKEQNQ